MKKRILAALMAVAMVATQSAFFPVSAYANTWVVDSSYAAGGYWMDDEGYIIESDSETSTQSSSDSGESEEQATEENTQEDLVNAQATGDATEGTITAINSTDPTQQQFSVTANGEVKFRFVTGGVTADPAYTYTDGLLSIADNQTSYNVYMYGGNKRIGSAVSNLAHTYSVTYNLGASSQIEVQAGVLYKGEDQRFTAESFYTDDAGNEFVLQNTNEATRILTYGKGAYSFTYVPYDPADKKLVITYVDSNGKALKTIEEPVVYKNNNGAVSVKLDENISIDGKTYTKDDPTSTITVDYDSAQLDYTITYREYTALAIDPYSVKVRYVDETGKVLGEDYFAVTAENLENDENVMFTAPASITTTDAGTVSSYQITDASKGNIVHAVTDNQTKTYTVAYTLTEANAPYTWKVNLAYVTKDAQGDEVSTIQQTESFEMTLNGDAVTYEAPSSIADEDGTIYYLKPGMSKTYTHKYMEKENSELTISYVAETDKGSFQYSVAVQYMSVTTNEIIGHGVAINMTPADTDINTGSNTGAKTVTAQQTIAVNNTDYVKLQGQEDIKADYYSPQRTYTIYYRDAADTQNADTVVTQQQVVTTDEVVTLPGTEEIVTTTETVADTTAADTTATDNAADTTADTANATPATTAATDNTTVLTNNTTGDTTTLNDQGVPLADVSNQQATLEDQKTPLADAPAAATATTTSVPMIVGYAVALAAVLGGIVFFILYSRKKQAK